jgi:Flp pilus assembly protein TadD
MKPRSRSATQRRDQGDWRHTAAAALLVLSTIVAYTPAFHAGYVWDDDLHITDNRHLKSAEGLRRIWFDMSRPNRIVIAQYYPLTHTTFWLEYQLWGLDPVGYHVVNVLLHAASALLLWAVLRRLGVSAAWVAAAVWALHPVMVESVAWATERKNVLSGFFYWAALLAYVRFDSLETVEKRARSWGWYAAALVAFGCALSSKSVTSTWPAAVLLVCWWKRGTISARDVWPLLPFFGAAATAGMVTSWMERHVVGAAGEDWSFTIADRVLIAGRVVWFYLAKLIAPVGLAFNYERWEIDPTAVWQWTFPIAAVVATAVLFAARGRIGRGPVAAWLFFVGTLTPALGFVDFYPMRFSFVADHFQYLAAAGAIVLVVGAVDAWSRRVPRKARALAVAAVLLVYGALTAARASVFRDSESLWLDTLRENPRSWLAHLNLEIHYRTRGDLERALEQARQAQPLRPQDATIVSRTALDLSLLGRREEARHEHERAVEMAPRNGNVLYSYAEDLIAWGEAEPAERFYRRAMEAKPDLPGVRNNLALLLAGRGEIEAAKQLYREEIDVDPESTRALINLAGLQLQSAALAEAETTLREALRIDPESAIARNTLAIIFLRRGDAAGAEREVRRALGLNPALPEAYNTLGNALIGQGRLDEAIGAYRAALRIRPGFTQAQTNLDLAIARRQARSGP